MSLNETLKRGFLLKCPACGKGALYSGGARGMLKVAPVCHHCGLDLKKQDAADGPAYIAMSIVGTLTVLLAFVMERAFSPPLWVHAVLWVPFIIIASVGVLIVAKSLFIALQYHHRKESFESVH